MSIESKHNKLIIFSVLLLWGHASLCLLVQMQYGLQIARNIQRE